MKKEKLEKSRVKKGKKFNFKAYVRDFLLFVDKKLIKAIGILLIVAILLIALSISSMLDIANSQSCEGACTDGMTILSEYGSKMQGLLIIVVAGIVPYIFAPVLGLLVYVLNEVSSFAYIIKGYGYLAGIGLGIVPLILNIFTICIATALGIYICRTVTKGYRISNLKNMNFTNFRIRLYEALKNEKKIETLTKTRDEKIQKLEAKKEKINYLQILNVAIILTIVQFISVLIEGIVL